MNRLVRRLIKRLIRRLTTRKATHKRDALIDFSPSRIKIDANAVPIFLFSLSLFGQFFIQFQFQ